MEEIKKMNVNGIGAGYPAAGYETRRTERNVAGRNYADQMCSMIPATQSSGGTFELHISNDKDVGRQIEGDANSELFFRHLSY